MGPRTFLKQIASFNLNSPFILSEIYQDDIKIKEIWSIDEDLERSESVLGARNHLPRMSISRDIFGAIQRRNPFPARRVGNLLRDSTSIFSDNALMLTEKKPVTLFCDIPDPI